MNAPQPHKHTIKNAQAKHLSALFGEVDVAAPSRQQADDHSRLRATQLQEAADRKKASLDEAEQDRLQELQAQAKLPAPPAVPTTPAAPAAPRSNLESLSARNDLAAAALSNMQNHMRRQAQSKSAASAPVTASPAPETPTKRTPPSPEELEKMLRQLSQRPSSRPRAGGPGAERGEAGFEAEPTPPEAPPETPPEDMPEQNAEKQAEILRQLQAQESQVQAQATPLAVPDQARASEKPVEAKLPQEVIKGNSLDAAKLHQFLVELQAKQTEHNAEGQVDTINAIQRELPHHPLSQTPHTPS